MLRRTFLGSVASAVCSVLATVYMPGIAFAPTIDELATGKWGVTVTVSRELLEDSGIDVEAYIAARLGERLARKQHEYEMEDERRFIYGDPTAPTPRGLIIAGEAT